MTSTSELIAGAEARLEELRQQLRPLLEEARQLEGMLAGARAASTTEAPADPVALLAEAAGITGLTPSAAPKPSRRASGGSSRRRRNMASASGLSTGAGGAAGAGTRRGRAGGPSSEQRREHLLALVRENPTMATKDIAERLGLQTNRVYRFIPPLREAGVLSGHGRANDPWVVDDSRPLPDEIVRGPKPKS